jgi:hypothetical protein
MAKDRANDSKRVYQTPDSHVNVTKDWQDVRRSAQKNKYDSRWNTDKERESLADSKAKAIEKSNSQQKSRDVIKIDSSN